MSEQEKLNTAGMSAAITKTYPKVNPYNGDKVDERIVLIEIETEESLPDEFFHALVNLVSAFTG